MHTANTHETLRLFVRVRVATSQHGGIYKIDPPSRPPGSGAGASNAATSCHWSGLVAVDQDAKASDFKLWHDLGTGGLPAGQTPCCARNRTLSSGGFRLSVVHIHIYTYTCVGTFTTLSIH